MGSTIFDVAKRAGVSIGTVSRVLNNRDRVRPETRERILKAIEELDYHANTFAQKLASQQTETLGLVIPQVNDPFFFEIVRGVEDAATSEGYSLLIVSQPRHTPEHRYLHLFRRGYVDGMILVAIDVHNREVQEIMDRGVPVILIQQDLGNAFPTALVDNYGGARAIIEHLIIEHGYRKIAYIAGTNLTPDNRNRLLALQDALTEHGLPEASIAQGDYLRGSGYRAMLYLLDLPDRPQAVFAANDQMAADAIMGARERGLRVPEDIAIVGFDDVPLATYVTPTLTTVHQPVYELGGQASYMLLNLLKARGNGKVPPPPRISLPTKLVIRRSCGCNR